MKTFGLLVSSLLANFSLGIASATDHDFSDKLTLRKGMSSPQKQTEAITNNITEYKVSDAAAAYDDDDLESSKACASFLQFSNDNCDGEPVSKYSFTTNGHRNNKCSKFL